MTAIQPVGVPPDGGNQQAVNRELIRVTNELIRELAAAQSQIDYLKARVR